MSKTEVVVIGVSRYDFTDRKTNENIKGAKVYYYELNNKSDDLIGVKPLTANIDYDAFNKYMDVPGVYEPDVVVSFSGSKPTIKVDGFKFLRPLK